MRKSNLKVAPSADPKVSVHVGTSAESKDITKSFTKGSFLKRFKALGGNEVKRKTNAGKKGPTHYARKGLSIFSGKRGTGARDVPNDEELPPELEKLNSWSTVRGGASENDNHKDDSVFGHLDETPDMSRPGKGNRSFGSAKFNTREGNNFTHAHGNKFLLESGDFDIGSRHISEKEGQEHTDVGKTFRRLPTEKEGKNLVDFLENFEFTDQVLSIGSQGEVRLARIRQGAHTFNRAVEAKREALELETNAGDIANLNDFEDIELGSANQTVSLLHASTNLRSLPEESEYVAVKIYQKDLMSKKLQRQARKEASLLMHVRHSNIVGAFGFYEDQTLMYLITEYISGGTLFDALGQMPLFTEHDARTIVYDLILALSHCHQRGLSHRDIKPSNILLRPRKHHMYAFKSRGGRSAKEALDNFEILAPAPEWIDVGETFIGSRDSYDIVLTDFGLAEQTDPDNGKKIGSSRSDSVGTLQFMAPEILKNEPYDYKVDIYALGVLLYMLLTGGHAPFERESEFTTRAAIISGTLSDIGDDSWETVSDDAKDLIRWMMHKDLNFRPTYADILGHSFFILSDKFLKKPINLNPLREFNLKLRKNKMIQDDIAAQIFVRNINGALERLSFQEVDARKRGDLDELKRLAATKFYMNVVQNSTDVPF